MRGIDPRIHLLANSDDNDNERPAIKHAHSF